MHIQNKFVEIVRLEISEKLIIDSSLHRNNRAVMLITKLVEEMK
jgi:hypothetical protein